MDHARRMYAPQHKKRITSQGGGIFLDPHPHASCVYDGRPSRITLVFLRCCQVPLSQNLLFRGGSHAFLTIFQFLRQFPKIIFRLIEKIILWGVDKLVKIVVRYLQENGAHLS
jgi:hypothetical protein